MVHQRNLGSTGIAIAPLVFGGNVFGWTADTARSFELLDRFVEKGLNFIDSADVYSAWAPGNKGGESEEVIGQWLKSRGCRERVVISTKVGMWEARKGLSARNIEQAVDESLRRLNTDYIDVYFAHIDDENTSLEESLTAFDRLVSSGKVRALGASNYGAVRLAQALQVAGEKQVSPYQVIQPLYNLYDRKEYEQTLEPLAERNNLGVIVYFALASGFLSGKYKSIDQIRNTPRERMLGKYFNPRGMSILDALQTVAKETGASPAQISLAWLLHKQSVTAPIVSATSTVQLDELICSFDLKLTESSMKLLDQASDS